LVTLDVWKKKEERAPHKPLLIVYALGQLLSEAKAKIAFAEYYEPFKRLLGLAHLLLFVGTRVIAFVSICYNASLRLGMFEFRMSAATHLMPPSLLQIPNKRQSPMHQHWVPASYLRVCHWP